MVIALTGLLLALILGPLVQAFRLTNRARALAEAQDATRFGIERLKRELSQAAYVFDNTNLPIVLPLDLAAPNTKRDPAIYPTAAGGVRPLVLNCKIDFIPNATQGEGPNTILDPTTDKPLGGTALSLPSAPGKRIVRYFIGLRYNTVKPGQPAPYYQNVYEFPRTDSELNPFVLYRAEYAPDDPNLFDQTQTRNGQPAYLANQYDIDKAGLHDPDFFYNTATATSINPITNRKGNGLTYAENWRAVSNPILATTNLDVLGWRRGSDRQLVNGSPFQTLVNFNPSTVVGDTAVAGFLSNTQAEAPGAVPTLYNAKFGQWVFPFTVTVYRGATQYSGDGANVPQDATFGRATFVFEKVDDGKGNTVTQVRRPDTGVGRLTANDTQYYWLQDSVNGKFYIFSPGLAFSVDSSRGRVETAFPPLATQNGVPLFVPAGQTANNTLPLNPGLAGNYGQLVPTFYQRNTRDDDPNDETAYGESQRSAGLAYTTVGGAVQYLPINQGIVRAELYDRSGVNGFKYVPISGVPNQVYPSPFNAFGNAINATPFQGILMVPGSEIVLGPDSILSRDPNRQRGTAPTGFTLLTTYFRVPAVVGTLAKKVSIVGDEKTQNGSRYLWTAQMNYRLEADLGNYATPYLQFDQPGQEPNAAAGLPAAAAGDGVQGDLHINFLWQNNYSRNNLGQPINAQGDPTTNNVNGADRNRVRPEADVIKLDYATRSLINVTMGARVFDASTKTAQSAQVADKVTVNNVSR